MSTNQEYSGVAYFINFLADDNAPDAESPYVFWGNASFYGTLEDARAFARDEVTRLHLCGYQITLSGKTIEDVIGCFDEDQSDDFDVYGDFAP